MLLFVGAVILAELLLHLAIESGLHSVPTPWRSVVDAVGVSIVAGPLFAWTVYRRQIDHKLASVTTATHRVPGSPHRRVRTAVLGSLIVILLLVGGSLWGYIFSTRPAALPHVAFSADSARVFLERLQTHHEAEMARSVRIATIIAILLTGLLVGMVLFVVEPVVRLLRRQHVAITEKSVEHERLAMVAQRTRNAVLISDAEHRVLWINEGFTRLTGWTLDEVLGKLPSDFLRSDETDRAAAAELDAHTRAGREYRCILRNRARDGRDFWVDISIEPLYVDGQLAGYLSVQVDVTSLKEHEAALRVAQERAEAANRAKSEFLANMSHEIRTPLTAILGHADLLRDELVEAGATVTQRQAVDTIQRAGEHLLRVLGEVLDISRIEAGRLVVEQEPIALPTLLRDVERLLRPRAAQRAVTLETRLGSAIPETIVGDGTRLQQVLMNLVGNAVKFTEQGRIVVEAAVSHGTGGPTLVVAVDDTGPGMTAEQAERLFEPFTQADGSVTRRYGGTGLGLTISRRLAELMGGSVELVRTAPGEGSRFELRVPLSTPEPVRWVDHLFVLRADDGTATAASALGRIAGRILLAEDGIDNQRLVTQVLAQAGAEVTLAADGLRALAEFNAARDRGAPFDLLVSDMQMPEMDGYTLARTLRARGETIPIVALTAHATAEDRARCLEAGCNDYAVKPIDRARFIATCARWLPRSTARSVTPVNVAAFGAEATTLTRLRSELRDDPELGPLARQFALALPVRVQALRDAVMRGEDATALRLAHQLKGAAGSYGFPAIGDSARALEGPIAKSDAVACSILLDRLARLADSAARPTPPTSHPAIPAGEAA